MPDGLGIRHLHMVRKSPEKSACLEIWYFNEMAHGFDCCLDSLVYQKVPSSMCVLRGGLCGSLYVSITVTYLNYVTHN